LVFVAIVTFAWSKHGQWMVKLVLFPCLRCAYGTFFDYKDCRIRPGSCLVFSFLCYYEETYKS